MAILVNEKTRVVVQGITGRDGSFHAQRMQEYGTKVVAGVTPGKGGTDLAGIPVFDTVRRAVEKTQANTSVLYVPPAFCADAILEAAHAGIELVVAVTEGVPTLDMARVLRRLAGTQTRLIGPNCPGLISPGKSKVGILPGRIHLPGHVGLVSRSGTLTYEVVWQLTSHDLGQTTCIGIGGDPIVGTSFLDTLRLFQDDPETHAVVLIGEIGGSAEEEAARFVKERMTKPVVSFIAGRSAPPGKRMGHAGAIISRGSGTAAEKVLALEAAGVRVATRPSDVPGLVRRALAA